MCFICQNLAQDSHDIYFPLGNQPVLYTVGYIFVPTVNQKDFGKLHLLDLNVHMYLYGNPQNISVANFTIIILHSILNYILMIEWSCAFAGMLGSPVLLI